jgi:hypothetical protein
MDERIPAIISELDVAVAREGAVVHFVRGSNHPHECALIANRSGYQRLGIEMLKAAEIPLELPFPERDGVTTGFVKVDLDYLLAKDSDIRFAEFIREERGFAPPVSSRKSGSFAWAAPVAYMVGVALVIGLILIGVLTVVRWIF